MYLGLVNSLCWVLLLAIAVLIVDMSTGMSQVHEHEIRELINFVKSFI